MKFKALIDGVHFDLKKGAVKIVLVGASYVSLDELTTLSPKDETIQVTLESEQTKIGVFSLSPNVGDPITLDEEAAAKLKEAARKLREAEKDEAPKEEEAGEALIDPPISTTPYGEEQ